MAGSSISVSPSSPGGRLPAVVWSGRMRRVSNSKRALAFALVVVSVVLAGAPAQARHTSDRSVDLDAAQRALENLRYEEARPLLERAWRSGQNGPQALATLFRLQGEVFATLGDEAAARR